MVLGTWHVGTLQGEAREQSVLPTPPETGNPDPGMEATCPQVSESRWEGQPSSEPVVALQAGTQLAYLVCK